MLIKLQQNPAFFRNRFQFIHPNWWNDTIAVEVANKNHLGNRKAIHTSMIMEGYSKSSNNVQANHTLNRNSDWIGTDAASKAQSYLKSWLHL